MADMQAAARAHRIGQTQEGLKEEEEDLFFFFLKNMFSVSVGDSPGVSVDD